MIITIQQLEAHSEDSFFALEDCFHCKYRIGDGYVQMCITPYFENENNPFVTIDFSDNIMERDGDYLPLYFDKEQLGQLIDFLKIQYEKFNDTETKS